MYSMGNRDLLNWLSSFFMITFLLIVLVDNVQAQSSLSTIEKIATVSIDATKSSEAKKDTENIKMEHLSIRSERSSNININIAILPSVMGFISYGTQVSNSIELRFSVTRFIQLLGYGAHGLILEGFYYLPPYKNFQNFVYINIGPTWMFFPERFRGRMGFMSSLQFGWDYVYDKGFNIWLAVGPILCFMRDAHPQAAIIRAGIGYRF